MSSLNLEKQLPKNIKMNLIAFILKILIGLYLTPYLIKYLGISAYGLIMIALFLSQYINIIIQSINSSINRFLLVAIQKKSSDEAITIYSSSFFMIILFMFFQSLIMIVILFNLNSIFSIPLELFNDTLWLFSLTFLGYTLSLIRGSVCAPIYANNRLDLLKNIEMVEILSRFILIVVFFNFFEANLIYVGIANLISSIISMIMAIYYKTFFEKYLKIRISSIDIEIIKKLISMSGWVLISQVAFLIFLKVDILLINKFMGADISGEYAIVVQVVTLIRTMATVLAGVITPVIMIYYANNEIDKLISLSKMSILLMGVLLSVPLGILAGFSGEILDLWVGKEFNHLSIFISISMIPLILNLSILPLLSINTAYNKVKLPALVSLGLGLLYVILLLLTLKYTLFGILGVIIINGLILTAKNSIFTPLYASYILKIEKLAFFKYQMIAMSFFTLSFIISYLLNFAVDNTLSFIIAFFLSLFISLTLALSYLYKNEEMTLLNNYILKKLKLPIKTKKEINE